MGLGRLVLWGLRDVRAEARRRGDVSLEEGLRPKLGVGSDRYTQTSSLRLRASARTTTAFRKTIARRGDTPESWLFLAVFDKNFPLAVMADFRRGFSADFQMLVGELAVIR